MVMSLRNLPIMSYELELRLLKKRYSIALHSGRQSLSYGDNHKAKDAEKKFVAIRDAALNDGSSSYIKLIPGITALAGETFILSTHENSNNGETSVQGHRFD